MSDGMTAREVTIALRERDDYKAMCERLVDELEMETLEDCRRASTALVLTEARALLEGK